MLTSMIPNLPQNAIAIALVASARVINAGKKSENTLFEQRERERGIEGRGGGGGGGRCIVNTGNVLA